MKKILILFATIAFLLPATKVESQVLSESAKRKFTVGVDLYTDIWQVTIEDPFVPAGYSNRTINQGANVFFMYNMQIGKGLSSFSFGLAIRNQNSYSNSVITNIKADNIEFRIIEELPHPDRDIPLSYNRSKINVTYLDLPIELKIRTDGGFKLGVGFKVGYLIDSKQKYVGEWPVEYTQPIQYNKVNEKTKNINQLQKWAYGPTLRIGYKFISVFGYYQLSNLFEAGRGPQMHPISLGITITPF